VTFTREQVERLLRPIRPERVSRNQQGHSHVEAWEITAHLTRLFGFGGWHKEILELTCISERSEEKGNRTGWWVVYRCSMRLYVGDWWTDDVATGDCSNLPSAGDAHDMACKTAVSQALKRCAKDLGDQFGLSLYNGGSTKASVGMTLVMPDDYVPPTDAIRDPEAYAQQPVPDADPEEGEGWTTTTTSTPTTTTPDGSGSAAAAVGTPTEPSPATPTPSTPGEITEQPSAQTDLGGQLPIATPREYIAEAKAKVAPDVMMISNSRLAKLHAVAAKVPALRGADRKETDALVQKFCIDWVLADTGDTVITSRSQLTMDQADRIIADLERMVP